MLSKTSTHQKQLARKLCVAIAFLHKKAINKYVIDIPFFIKKYYKYLQMFQFPLRIIISTVFFLMTFSI
jgi:hypothetical protein